MADKPQVPPVAPVLGSAATGQIVTILIGPKKKTYVIHKDIICHYSEYFRTAYNGRWKESDEGVTLEDVEVEVFNVFVHWLYMQQIPTEARDFNRIANVEPEEEYNYDDGRGFQGSLLLKACAFGNRFLAADFERLLHNRIVDHFANTKNTMTYKHVIFAYENLPGHRQLLALMVEMQCLWWDPDWDVDDKEQLRSDLPKEFLIRVMIRLVEFREKSGHEYTEIKKGSFYMQEDAEKMEE